MRMIQPINALTPRVGFRGKHGTYNNVSFGQNDSRVALINAAGVATAAGALTTLVARAYTKSFGQAGVLGIFGGLLTMFFMTPHLIDKIGLSKVAKKTNAESVAKHDFPKISKVAKEYAIPVKKLVQFRSEPA